MLFTVGKCILCSNLFTLSSWWKGGKGINLFLFLFLLDICLDIWDFLIFQRCLILFIALKCVESQNHLYVYEIRNWVTICCTTRPKWYNFVFQGSLDKSVNSVRGTWWPTSWNISAAKIMLLTSFKGCRNQYWNSF